MAGQPPPVPAAVLRRRGSAEADTWRESGFDTDLIWQSLFPATFRTLDAGLPWRFRVLVSKRGQPSMTVAG